ncbi:MAG: ABC transporter ATP-binding protein [Candidatus Schekmanbacteria bacterium]|nr:ABC transporter ATP-binding protein [Candidatus Schekmanbacteria bacterium]
MIAIDKVSCRAGQHSISDVSFTVNDGEYFTILGPTGAGKTMLLECIAGLRETQSGRIMVNGDDISNKPPEQRKFGYVPQDHVLFPFHNVRDNIFFGCGNITSENIKKLDELSKLFRIEGILERMPQQLSGGEKQRVSLVRALVRNPAILLLDEPYSSIDEGLRKKLWIDMREIHKDLSTTVIHITHDLEEAFTLSNKMAVLIDGKIAQCGSRESIFYSPANKQVAGFLGIRNIFTGTVKSADKNTDRIVVECPYDIVTPWREGIREGMKIEFCVFPQEIKIIKSWREIRKSLEDNVFEGKIVNVIPHGVSFTLYFKIIRPLGGEEEFDFEINIPSANFMKLSLTNGSDIRVALRKNAINVFAHAG